MFYCLFQALWTCTQLMAQLDLAQLDDQEESAVDDVAKSDSTSTNDFKCHRLKVFHALCWWFLPTLVIVCLGGPQAAWLFPLQWLAARACHYKPLYLVMASAPGVEALNNDVSWLTRLFHVLVTDTLSRLLYAMAVAPLCAE